MSWNVFENYQLSIFGGIHIILVMPLLQQIFALDPLMGPVPPEVMGAGIIGGIIGGICGGLLTAVIGGVLDAVGGVLDAGFVK